MKSRNFAAITGPAKVGELMRAIHGYSGHPVTALALKLAPLVSVPRGELRAAQWSEFDLDSAEWRIPAVRIKMGLPHVANFAGNHDFPLRIERVHRRGLGKQL